MLNCERSTSSRSRWRYPAIIETIKLDTLIKLSCIKNLLLDTYFLLSLFRLFTTRHKDIKQNKRIIMTVKTGLL